jgi:hypothetical protein
MFMRKQEGVHNFEKSLARKMQEEFGIPDPRAEIFTMQRTYEQGARCDLNLSCRRVGTNLCDITSCQSGVIRSSRMED